MIREALPEDFESIEQLAKTMPELSASKEYGFYEEDEYIDLIDDEKSIMLVIADPNVEG